MTRDEILNRIAIKKHGRHFNEIFAIKNRAEILQQALDEALEQVNNNTVLQNVMPSTFDFIIEYDDEDGTMAKTVITGDNAPDAIWKFTEQYGLEWITIKKVE